MTARTPTAGAGAEPHEWHHSAKGRIIGTIAWEDDTWLGIRLAGDHQLNYYSESSRGHVDRDGDVLVVRKSRLR